MEQITEKEIEKAALVIMNRASQQTLTDTICKLASSLGLPEICGRPVRTYISEQQVLHEEALCEEFSASNPALASHVLERIRSLRS